MSRVIVGLVLLIVTAGLIAIVNSTIVIDYPLRDGRDWLDMLADFGKAMGSLALIGLVLQVIWRSTDQYKSSTPHVDSTIIEIVTIDDRDAENNAIYCLTEDNHDELPQTTKYEEYRKYYNHINPEGNRFIKIGLKNAKTTQDTTAYKVELKVSIQFKDNPNGNVLNSQTITCPGNNELTITPGQERNLYINCTVNNTRLRYIIIRIVSIEFYNLKDNKFSGSATNFKPRHVEVQEINP